MKTKTSFLLIAATVITLAFVPVSPGKKFHYVDAGSLTKAESDGNKEVPVNAFLMSEEVTNKEYREFIDALKANPDGILHEFDLKAYQETKDLDKAIKEFTYASILQDAMPANAGETEDYFTNKKFDNYPVAGVSYESANLYCDWKSKEFNRSPKTDLLQVFTLPTELEWEYAAQNNEIAKHLNSKKLHTVNSGEKNAFGLHQMHGNVAEWTTNRQQESVIRGSSWKTERTAEARKVTKPDYKDGETGFRMVMRYMKASSSVNDLDERPK